MSRILAASSSGMSSSTGAAGADCLGAFGMGFGFGVGFLTPGILALPSSLEISPASLPGGPPSPLMADGVQMVERTLSHDPIGGLCVCWAIIWPWENGGEINTYFSRAFLFVANP